MLLLLRPPQLKTKPLLGLSLLVLESKCTLPPCGSHLLFCPLSSFMFQAKQPSSQPASRYCSGQVGTRAIRRGIEAVSSTSSWLKKSREQAVKWCCDSYRLLDWPHLVFEPLPCFEIVVTVWNPNIPECNSLVIGCSCGTQKRSR